MLKKLAIQKLTERFLSGSLNPSDTKSAAEEGANSLLDIVKSNISAGSVSDIVSLFSNDKNPTESNPIFGLFKDKIGSILQSKGLGESEATSEASSVSLGVIEDIKEKFLSNDEADSKFDLNDIAGLLGGGGNLLDKAKSLF